MPVTTNLGMAVSSNEQDYVLDYWMKMLNEENGNFVLLDNEFGVLASKLAFTIYPNTWVAENNAPFYYKSTVTMNAIVQDNSIVEAYFEDILVSTGVILHSVTQNGTEVTLVFYADAAKQSAVSGFIKYVYSVPGQQPLPVPSANVMSKTFTANGTYNAHDENKDGYNPINIDVAPNVAPLSVTTNGTYSAPAGTDGYNPIDVNVPDTGAKFMQGIVTEMSDEGVFEIKASQFVSFNFLRSVSFPNCIYIGSSAFQNCFGLTSISFPNCLTIGQNAFGQCYPLTEANFPNCLSISGTNPFQGCSGLISVNLPFISSFSISFYNCYSLRDVNIPFFRDTGWGYIFSGCRSLKSINLPAFNKNLTSGFFSGCSSLEYVSGRFAACGSSAFYNCYSLKSIEAIYGNLAIGTAGSSAFYNCSSLSELTLFGTCYNNAFQNCISLRKLNFYGYIIGSFGEYAFQNCSSLSQIYRLNMSLSITPLANVNAFQNTPMSDSSYLGYFGSIYVHPDRVEAYKSATNWATYSDRIVAAPSEIVNKGVWAYEFYNSTITEVPSEKLDAETIGGYAFANCSQLTKISMSRVSLINTYAFQNCTALSTISFPECKTLLDFAFQSCSSLTSVYLPNLKNINAGFGFANCSMLSEINLPECEFIDGNYLFSSCSLLSTINIPKCKYFLAQEAFHGCSMLSEINLPECIYINCAFPSNLKSISASKALIVTGMQNTRLTIADFPNCKHLLQYAFRSCFSLTEANFPECLNVGDSAFLGCSSLASISFPNCLSIGSSAFALCSALTEANFPECLNIGSYAFYYCSHLSSISFPNCSNIGSYAFMNCSVLSSISFPNCLSIGNYAFTYCSALKEANFPNCLSIRQNVFMNCSVLSSISFPNCLNIEGSAFYNCSALSKTYFLGSMVPFLSSNNVFQNTPMSNSAYLGYFGSIYVRASLLTQYQSALNWSYYSDRLVGLTDEEIAALDNQ